MKRIGLLMVLVAACSESAPGVGEQEAEITCRAWCDPINTCGAGYGDPPACLQSCMGEAQQVCGEHLHAKRLCELEMDCNDPFEDCKVHDQDRSKCQADISAQCAEQCPEADQQLCFNARGNCGLVADCAERCPIEPDYCVENDGQCGLQDRCHQECLPIDGIPNRPGWCIETEGDCGRVDACAAACRNVPNPQVFRDCLAGHIEPADCQ
jgi:hypothetical protein